MSYANGPKIVTDGLVLCLDAANRKSYPGTGTTWYDLSGNGNHGTFGASTAAPTFSSVNGGILNFDGNDRISGPNSSSLMLTTNFTLDAWVKRTSTQSTEQVIMAKNGDTSPWVGWELMFGTDNTIRLWTSGSAGNGWTAFSHSITDLLWNNITVTFYGTAGSTGTALLYVNGIQKATMSNKITPGTPSLRIFEIGCIRANSRFLSGGIASAKVYNTTLTSQEILQNYNALKGRYGLT